VKKKRAKGGRPSTDITLASFDNHVGGFEKFVLHRLRERGPTGARSIDPKTTAEKMLEKGGHEGSICANRGARRRKHRDECRFGKKKVGPTDDIAKSRIVRAGAKKEKSQEPSELSRETYHYSNCAQGRKKGRNHLEHDGRPTGHQRVVSKFGKMHKVLGAKGYRDWQACFWKKKTGESRNRMEPTAVRNMMNPRRPEWAYREDRAESRLITPGNTKTKDQFKSQPTDPWSEDRPVGKSSALEITSTRPKESSGWAHKKKVLLDS